MAHNPKFPTFVPLVLSCGCRISVGSNVKPAAIEKCGKCRVKVTAVLELAPPVESPSPVIVPEEGAQMRLDV